MRIAPLDQAAFHRDHPRGSVSFNYLLMGDDPQSPENYRYILGRQEADFHMPRHRHTFEQIRLSLVGDMNLGQQGILHAGEIGYFPEGQIYGPQDDPLGDARPGERLQLVLQFGGASGLGMSVGRARGPRGPQDSPRRKRPIRFPRPRYDNVIILDPGHFNWLPLPGTAGVERKYFGSFTERAFWIERIKIDRGAAWTSTCEQARRLIVVLAGSGTANCREIGGLTAIEADAGERLLVRATTEMELHIVGLPPVQSPRIPSDQFDMVESTGAIQFENPSDAD